MKFTNESVFIVILFAILSGFFFLLEREDFAVQSAGELWIADQALRQSQEMNYQWALSQEDCGRIRAYFKGIFE